MYDVQGLQLILPVAEIHLLVWTQSDTGALLIYAETCVSSGFGRLSGSGLLSRCFLSKVMRIFCMCKANEILIIVCEQWESYATMNLSGF